MLAARLAPRLGFLSNLAPGLGSPLFLPERVPDLCDSKKASHPTLVVGFFLALPGYTGPMLWIKALHIVFVASWFAGLFYLPRIFVNLAMVPADSTAERERLLLMARKLLRFTNLLAIPALGLGLWLWAYYKIGYGPGNAWMHAKWVFIVLTLAYHHLCGRHLRQWERGENTHSHVWYRWFNEVPVILLLVVVILVVVKPF